MTRTSTGLVAEEDQAMHSKAHSYSSIFDTSWSLVNAAQIIILVLSFVIFLLLFMTVAVGPIQGQAFQVIHSFNVSDGAEPYSGLTWDANGNLYGTTSAGGPGCACGTVFKMSYDDLGWSLISLYAFKGSPDGASPGGEVVFGAGGTLYGTTYYGGVQAGCGPYPCGTVFSLNPSATPPPSIFDTWSESILYRFGAGSRDGYDPFGPVVFDQQGNMYGTASGGGAFGFGAVYKLAPSSGGWKKSTIYSFKGGNDGKRPSGALIFDQAGNLYGTTWQGGSGGVGTVYKLLPSSSGWTKTTLYSFQGQGDGIQPGAGLIFDPYGNLYGTTGWGGDLGGGTVFELTPFEGNCSFTLLHSFGGLVGSLDSLTMDAAGNLYGTTYSGGAYGNGNVFKLTPGTGGWTYSSLHDFTGGDDGSLPVSNVIFDSAGNLYGTTFLGGTSGGCGGPGCGVVWEIVP